VLQWIESHLGTGYEWPGNVRELEQCVRNVLIRSEYRPAASGTSDDNWLTHARDGKLTAEELVERYCVAIYERTGSYLETARRLGLDRRTVKSRIDASRNRSRKR
jgi:transcriptional regulator of acetoin/glycerol metabolism